MTRPNAFIEAQFPVSQLSKESYKERQANYSQTLTGLGKWWGRKPLVLVRASILGLLLPASDAPHKDREIFLKLMTMDEEGLWRRKSKPIPLAVVSSFLTAEEQARWFSPFKEGGRLALRKGITSEERETVQRLAFSRLSYDQKLEYCDRPEHVPGPAPRDWTEINTHLGTSASSVSELVVELGRRQFGRVPRVGDAFSGGGSIPFEAARIGCDSFGSDLNPVSALLTWAGLNIVGGNPGATDEVKRVDERTYDVVNAQMKAWGVEHNELGWRADAFLYCTEVTCPECGFKVPLAPSWAIGEKSHCIAVLKPDKPNKRFEIEIQVGVSDAELATAKHNGTIRGSYVHCPNCPAPTPISMIRGDGLGENGASNRLRRWEKADIVPRVDDVFQERLYCMRWLEEYVDTNGVVKTRRRYESVNSQDLARESKVLGLLQQRFAQWQARGFIPSRWIEPGYNTDQPIRERGWTHWHHLFNPRQLLLLGTYMETLDSLAAPVHGKVDALLELGRLIDTKGVGCKLLRWNSHSSKEMHATVFSNQALNTLYNYCHRTLASIEPSEQKSAPITGKSVVEVGDARVVTTENDLWITDPPYADAVNYHELTEFFLAWYDQEIRRNFPGWYSDSKRVLAITGDDDSFRRGMVECYRNLTQHMPNNGAQIVMFTHQDVSVWADLALILWASGLMVTAAWCIATETASELKDGNYVQGTVLLVLRKQTSDETAFLDDIYPQVEPAVRSQLNAMLSLETGEDRNFSDTDYQLAAYAAALRVLTRYRNIEDVDVARELSRVRKKGERSPLEDVIETAVKIACDHLIPQGFDSFAWKMLSAEERFYVKGLDMERHGERRSGAYQELARGFGVRDYTPLLATTKANETRLRTATEFGGRLLDGTGFASSVSRLALFAVQEVVRTEGTEGARAWLRTQLKDQYWAQRKYLLEILRYVAELEHNAGMPQWKQDAHAARLLAGAVANDHV